MSKLVKRAFNPIVHPFRAMGLNKNKKSATPIDLKAQPLSADEISDIQRNLGAVGARRRRRFPRSILGGDEEVLG